jgi:hypothetical protein
MVATHGPSAASRCEFGQSDGPVQRHLRCFDPRFSSPSVCLCRARSGWMPRKSLDPPEHLPEQAPRQVTFGQQEDEANTRIAGTDPPERIVDCVRCGDR